MMSIVVLTATYNHPKELTVLYRSLLNQTDKDFSWIIVNDGSGLETQDVLNGINNEKKLDVYIQHQINGGKSQAINRGLDLIDDKCEFVIIVDDDENLYEHAIATIRKYIEDYKTTDCGVIFFNHKDKKGNYIARPFIDNDFFMPFSTHEEKRLYADGYLGYFTKKLGNHRFTIYEGEKYIGPSTLISKVTKKSKLLWCKEALGETEYLAGGITSQGRRLRIKAPMGGIEYCKTMIQGVGIRQRVKYSILGFSYYFLLDERKRNSELADGFMQVAKPVGFLLANYWKMKYQ